MVVDLSSLLPSIESFSGAGAVGALLGYGFKKLVKILLVILAAFTALIGIPLGYLTYEGVITINWDRLYALLDSAAVAGISWGVEISTVGVLKRVQRELLRALVEQVETTSFHSTQDNIYAVRVRVGAMSEKQCEKFLRKRVHLI